MSTALHGQQWIAGSTGAQSDQTFRPTSPNHSQALDPPYHEATSDEVNRAMEAADACFDDFRMRTPEQRAAFLDAIADAVMNIGDALLERAHEETGLPMPRLTGERGRAVGQTKLFAKVIREGSWVDARIDRPDPAREPLPKPDVRRLLVPIGPVVVFGASNFPLAISVIGSDTVSALGAGCPVVVKAHPAHPGTCELLAGAVAAAAKKTGMPEGVFSMVHGAGFESGMALVNHPLTQAVAFTGSLRGGRALFDAAAARPNPIPVYAEMGSTNPIFVLPGAMAERGEQIAAGYVGSVTLGVGQFCTNPGVLLGVAGESMNKFTEAVSTAAAEAAPATMLHGGIRDAYEQGLGRIESTDGVAVLGRSGQDPDANATQAACTIYSTDSGTLSRKEELWEEVFGPSSVVVHCADSGELAAIAETLDGHLAATIHGTEKDLAEHAGLLRVLERKVGRLIFNGFPTGIEVCAAMHHGGPYPATTHSHFTSIGTGSILRFVRPLCYQGFPDSALPRELQDGNPAGVWRELDNEHTRDGFER